MKQLTTTRSIPQLSIQRNTPGWLNFLAGLFRPMSYGDKLSQSLASGLNSVRWQNGR